MDDGSGMRSKPFLSDGFIGAAEEDSSANDADTNQVRIELGLAFESRSVGRVVTLPLTLPRHEASRTIELYPRYPDSAQFSDYPCGIERRATTPCTRVVSWP
jgi:hypothetical protein